MGLRPVHRRTCRTRTPPTTTVSNRARQESSSLEFWITPFDYASAAMCPQRAIESQLTENKLIGLSWCLIDYDDVNAKEARDSGIFRTSRRFSAIADQLVGFRLMPPEAAPKGPPGEVDAQSGRHESPARLVHRISRLARLRRGSGTSAMAARLPTSTRSTHTRAPATSW